MSIGDIGKERLAEIFSQKMPKPTGDVKVEKKPATIRDSLETLQGSKKGEAGLGASSGSPKLPSPNKELLSNQAEETKNVSKPEGDFTEKLKDAQSLAALAEKLLGKEKLLEALTLFFEGKLPDNLGSEAFTEALRSIILSQVSSEQSLYPQAIPGVSEGAVEVLKLLKNRLNKEIQRRAAENYALTLEEAGKLHLPPEKATIAGEKAYALTKNSALAFAAANAALIGDAPLGNFVASTIEKEWPEAFSHPEYGALAESGVKIGALLLPALAQLGVGLTADKSALLPAAAVGAAPLSEAGEKQAIGLMAAFLLPLAETKRLANLEKERGSAGVKEVARLLEALLAKVVSAIADAMVKGVQEAARLAKEYAAIKDVDDAEKKQAIQNKAIAKGKKEAFLLAQEVLEILTEGLKEAHKLLPDSIAVRQLKENLVAVKLPKLPQEKWELPKAFENIKQEYLTEVRETLERFLKQPEGVEETAEAARAA